MERGAMTDRSHREVHVDAEGDLVWAGHNMGPQVAAVFGGSEYEFWRTIRAVHLAALTRALGGQPGADVAQLVRQRFESDVDLNQFAEAHGIPTEFSSYSSG